MSELTSVRYGKNPPGGCIGVYVKLNHHYLHHSQYIQCTLLVFQDNSPVSIVVKPDCFTEKLILCIPEKIQNLITVENLLSANMNFNSILGLLECRLLALRQTLDHPLLSSTVGRSVNPGGVSRNQMGMNLPLSLIEIGLTMDFLKEVFGLNYLPKFFLGGGLPPASYGPTNRPHGEQLYPSN